MPFGTEDRGTPSYDLELEDVSNNVRLMIGNIDPYFVTGSPDEADNDATFQKLLDRIEGDSDLTIISATKRIKSSAGATVTP